MTESKNNTGDRNTGDWNTGNLNTGDWNTGYLNTGDLNTGNRNTGDWNTGNLNTGDWNTGNLNTGDRNTGYLNTGDWNTGYCNTKESPMYCFDKPCGFTRSEFEEENGGMPIYPLLTEWIDQSQMTQVEKEAHPEFGNTGGYLRKNDFKESFIKAYNAATVEQKAWFEKLPNFDAQIFFDITGADVRVGAEPSMSGEIVTVTIRGKEYTAIIQ